MLSFLAVAFVSIAMALVPATASGETSMQAKNEKAVRWLVEVTIKDNQLENLKDLIVEMSDRAYANEPGTLSYVWMISEDGSTGQIYERYATSDAALTHLASFNQHFAERVGAMADLVRQTVYGNPSDALKQALAGANPIYLPQFGGFDR